MYYSPSRSRSDNRYTHKIFENQSIIAHPVGYFYYGTHLLEEARWPSGRAPDSGARGRGVRSLLGSPCCIIEQDTFTSQKGLAILGKRWLRPDMTEKLLIWT